MILRRRIRRISHKLDMLSVRTTKAILHPLIRPREKRRAFVAGVQRSGTNMLMKMLERSLETQVFHETNPRAFDNFQMRERGVIQQLASQSQAPLMVIKALCEAEQLPELMSDFAPARGVWIVRRMDDVVNSSLRSFSTVADTVREMVTDPTMGGWWGRGMSDTTHRLLQRHGQPELSDASAVALFWYLRNVLYFERQLDGREDVLLLHYEDLVTQPEAVGRRLFAFLDLRFARRCTWQIVPSSIKRHQAPDIDPAIRVLCEDLQARFQALAQD